MKQLNLFDSISSTLTPNERRIVDALRECPDITNTDLAEITYMSPSTLNKATKGLYKKLGIDGNGREKRAVLLAKLNE